jgi:hypothetical protein
MEAILNFREIVDVGFNPKRCLKFFPKVSHPGTPLHKDLIAIP